jgi:hypothetical protein
MKGATIACGTAVATVVICLGVTPIAGQAPAAGQVPAPGQFPAYKAPRVAGTANPDLNGIWQAITTANWDIQDHDAQPGLHPELEGAYDAQPPGQGIVEAGEIPYQPWALAKRKENFAKRAIVDVSDDVKRHETGDPELKCFMPGVPRAAYMPFPFQIVQGSSPFILMSYEYTDSTRIVRMNWKGEAPTDSWMGWSRGHWDGDTLVIDVTGFRPESWFDRAGDFHSDALHVVERYTPASPYHMMYEATIEDPKVFTRPWKISFPLYRLMEKRVQLLEYKCVPFTEELIYGKFKKPGD